MRKSFVTGLVSVLAAVVCGEEMQGTGLKDRSIEAYQVELLGAAYDISTMIPLDPHIKDRARSQEKVVRAALDLDQPSRAYTYIQRIPNWRKGLAYAEYAYYCVEQGATESVEKYLNIADAVSQTAEQEWRTEKVQRRIMMTWQQLGNEANAQAHRKRAVEGEVAAPLDEVDSDSIADDGYVDFSMKLDEQIAGGNMDYVKGALYAYTRFYDRFYDNQDLRGKIETKIRGGFRSIARIEQIWLMEILADVALKHDDQLEARRFADEISELLKITQWPVENRVQMAGTLASLRVRCGQKKEALNGLDEALTLYHAHKKSIYDIYRAEALIPLAEAYMNAGSQGDALKIYTDALESAVLNPNSRPRALGMSDICVSMAVSGCEPNEAFLNRLTEYKAMLGNPW